MSNSNVSRWERSEHYEISYVSKRATIQELVNEAKEYLDDPENTWHMDGESIIFKRSIGAEMTGREDKP